MDHVIPEISHKWYEFGSALAITPLQLEEIKNHPGDRNHHAFADIIQIWQTEYPCPFTWETLIIMSVSQVNGRESVLESTVNECQLLQDLNLKDMEMFNFYDCV